MFGLLKSPIEDGVRAGVKAGLDKSFGPGGPFARALGAALEPVKKELDDLRYYKARHSWQPLAIAPAWVKDGRTMLVWNGEMRWAAFVTDDGESWWDADVEYGGTVVEPQPTHFLILPKPPASQPHPINTETET